MDRQIRIMAGLQALIESANDIKPFPPKVDTVSPMIFLLKIKADEKEKGKEKTKV